MQIAGYERASVVDGPGIRFTIFSQGCSHKCEGCHNPDTWDKTLGKSLTTHQIFTMIENEKYISGVTFSGGEPYEQENDFLTLAKRIKQELGLNIWCYTGYTYEEIKDRPLTKFVDFIVDGKFVLELKDSDFLFRGSSNQRIIDVKQNSVIEFKRDSDRI